MTTPLNPDRFFSPDPATRRFARELYEPIAGLPIISPHGHVNPQIFSNPGATFGSPADLFIIPDHYVTRMLYSQGIPLESLGVPEKNGPAQSGSRTSVSHHEVWRLFCEHFHLLRGTPSGIWLTHELNEVFGIDEKPCAANADRLYTIIAEKLALPEFSPRSLFERFNIEVLATTDAATDTLDHHLTIRSSGWDGRIIPTFRPDAVVNLDAPGWRSQIERLSEVSGVTISNYASYIQALEQRRTYFRKIGAAATDHAALYPTTLELTGSEAEAIFQRALAGRSQTEDAPRFTAHMLVEMARMSVEDGLVMQLHPGSLRNHNESLYQRFGTDMGADIPITTEYTRNLHPLLNKFGNDKRLTLVLFTLDETTYARELAVLAGHYPALRLGPPWWFHDSLNGMSRFFDQVMETAGIYNTAGFNDDTRAFCSIPARHDVWRRCAANWLGGLVARHIVDLHDGHEMAAALAVGLVKQTYKL